MASRPPFQASSKQNPSISAAKLENKSKMELEKPQFHFKMPYTNNRALFTASNRR